MNIKKMIPITTLLLAPAAIATFSFASCSQYHFINVINGYKPTVDPILEYQFNDYAEVIKYYSNLNKDILTQDFIWSLGEYVKENLEFPEPVFDFKFTEITQALISVEDWWTQPYTDTSKSNTFMSSFSLNFQLSGTTEPRNSTPIGSYLPYSNAILSMTMHIYKFPFTIINKTVGVNKTDARWIIRPATLDILEKDSVWNVSCTTQINYILQAELEHSLTTRDSLSIYWHNTNLYEPTKQQDISQLLKFSFDSLIYGSYHLKNCTLKI